ncbi:MAG: glutamate-5-semialdehyde dehydrogenase [Clostridia bacterium]|nr:glutamate-5-semialdehyde dehydrogenase [Clostridia bacterium]
MFNLIDSAKKTKIASEKLSELDIKQIDKALIDVADSILEKKEYIKNKNKIDIKNAKQKGLSEGFIDRLLLTDNIIYSIADGIKKVAKLSSPVGKTVYSFKNKKQKINIKKVLVPFGVIGIIFESRPNVACDAFALCFKTKNAVMLRGGSDAINSITALVKVIKNSLKKNEIDENVISVVEDCSHETAKKFMKLDKYIDLLIPRGGANLIDTAKKESTVPVIETGKGNCHIYVDKCANVNMASKIIFNAKTQRYSVCNACESIMIHSDILSKALPKIKDELSKKDIEMRCDKRAYEVIKDYKHVKKATEEDFFTEYGGPVISVETVDSEKEAIDKINERSTHHSESIITDNSERAKTFFAGVDSACVYHNASTRFSDGFVFGLGAEIGIATQKLHARGPMGLEALVTTKYIVKGKGSVRK